MKNQVQLIAYTDRFSGGDLNDLRNLLTDHLRGVIGGIHILPFYYPIDGSDAGFDPIDHKKIDPQLGNWEDIKRLSKEVDIMADLIVNHVSSDSEQFNDFNLLGESSKFSGLFLTYDTIFKDGAKEKDLMNIYRPRPGLPFTYTTLKSGKKCLLWTTFTSKQVDIDVNHPSGQEYLNQILKTFAKNGIKMIRLDAAGYAIKKAGTSCFMIPETFDFIDKLSEKASRLGIESLVEIHSHYQTQIEIAKKVGWVYDFALPPLLLHAFFFNTGKYLKHWITIRPTNSITVLDTHDGIGIVDIGPEHSRSKPGLIPDEELDQMVEIIHQKSKGESLKATGAAASNLDLYQVNCTYFDALGADPLQYLLARAIQFFLPGIPQVYYIGLLMGQNDMTLLEETNVGRDINRHYYTQDEIKESLQNPHVKTLIELIRLRNTHPSFGGDFTLQPINENSLSLLWKKNEAYANLEVNFKSLSYSLIYSSQGEEKSIQLI